MAGGRDGGGTTISVVILFLSLLTFELSRHGCDRSSCLSWLLRLAAGAVSPSPCLSLIISIRGMASLAWGSLSPNLIAWDSQRKQPGW